MQQIKSERFPALTPHQAAALALLPMIHPRVRAGVYAHKVATTPKGGAPFVVQHTGTVVMHERTLEALENKGYLTVVGVQGMSTLVQRTK